MFEISRVDCSWFRLIMSGGTEGADVHVGLSGFVYLCLKTSAFKTWIYILCCPVRI